MVVTAVRKIPNVLIGKVFDGDNPKVKKSKKENSTRNAQLACLFSAKSRSNARAIDWQNRDVGKGA
jgi:hypothetical protein